MSMRPALNARVHLWIASGAATAFVLASLISTAPAADTVGWRYDGEGGFKAIDWQGRVDASLSLANGRLYIQSTNGTTLVVESTPDCPEVARNKSEGSSSSSFFIDDRILFRTPTRLICVGRELKQAELDRRQ